MVNSTNGKTIKIPVKPARPKLLSAEEPQRLMLAGPAKSQETSVEGLPPETDAREFDHQEQAGDWRTAVEAARKQTERRAQIRLREERHRLLNRMLDVLDNLERAVAHAPEQDPLSAGIELILSDLREQLAREGVELVHALGRRFDPTLHEAVATDGPGADTVVEVLKNGYTLEGELLRPAQVIVGRAR
jgi:molecular chaperone GrpE